MMEKVTPPKRGAQSGSRWIGGTVLVLVVSVLGLGYESWTLNEENQRLREDLTAVVTAQVSAVVTAQVSDLDPTRDENFGDLDAELGEIASDLGQIGTYLGSVEERLDALEECTEALVDRGDDTGEARLSPLRRWC